MGLHAASCQAQPGRTFKSGQNYYVTCHVAVVGVVKQSSRHAPEEEHGWRVLTLLSEAACYQCHFIQKIPQLEPVTSKRGEETGRTACRSGLEEEGQLQCNGTPPQSPWLLYITTSRKQEVTSATS